MLRNNIKVQVQVQNWQDAIREAGSLLVQAKSCTTDYVEGMVQAVEELGPYIVITPYVALAHTRPSEKVMRSDISLAVLAEPVVFNHQTNDPVKLVFAFCAKSNEGHLQQLEQLSTYLSDPETIDRLATANTVTAVLDIINKN